MRGRYDQGLRFGEHRVNTQAKIIGGQWFDYGATTHVDAARQHAKMFPFRQSRIITRREDRPEVEFDHDVMMVTMFEVTPRRHDA